MAFCGQFLTNRLPVVKKVFPVFLACKHSIFGLPANRFERGEQLGVHCKEDSDRGYFWTRKIKIAQIVH